MRARMTLTPSVLFKHLCSHLLRRPILPPFMVGNGLGRFFDRMGSKDGVAPNGECLWQRDIPLDRSAVRQSAVKVSLVWD
jgi:hypothetical protein